MKKSGAPESATLVGETNGKSHRERLLIVDDSESCRAMICEHLRQDQFEYDQAENGAVAVEKAKATHFDLILMDIQMPMMDGYEAIRRIRLWEEGRGLSRTPIIAFTASSFEEDVQRAVESGADLHVSKPVKKQALAAAIRSLLPDEANEGATGKHALPAVGGCFLPNEAK
jgi:CheY-like chemotaxis protein